MSKNITIEKMNENYNMLLNRINYCESIDQLYEVFDIVDEYAAGDGITSSQYKALLEAIDDKELELDCVY